MKCPFIHTAYQERDERERERERTNESWRGMVSSIFVPTGGGRARGGGGGGVATRKGAEAGRGGGRELDR